MSKVFSTHPPTDDRIKAVQKDIDTMLKARPEYVLTTSEFNDVKARLAVMHNRRRVDESKDPSKPTLRRTPGSGPIDPNDGPNSKGDDDDRPTLKRRPTS